MTKTDKRLQSDTSRLIYSYPADTKRDEQSYTTLEHSKQEDSPVMQAPQLHSKFSYSILHGRMDPRYNFSKSQHVSLHNGP